MKMFGALICLGFWSCSVLSQGEIERYQRDLLYEFKMGVVKTPVNASWVRFRVYDRWVPLLVPDAKSRFIEMWVRFIGSRLYKHGVQVEEFDLGSGKGSKIIMDEKVLTKEQLGIEWDDGWGLVVSEDVKGKKEIYFGKHWVDKMSFSEMIMEDDAMVLKPKGELGVYEEVKIKGAEWIAKFTIYLAELERQQKFYKEKSVLLRDNAKEKLLTSRETRDQSKWWEESKITLSYDAVPEEFEPTDEDIITIIRQVGEDKNNQVLNLSGCQSQECIDALIDLLKHSQDVEIVNLANCNLTLENAQRLLAVIQNSTQLQIINVSGNNLPHGVVQALLAALANNDFDIHSLAMDCFDSNTVDLLALDTLEHGLPVNTTMVNSEAVSSEFAHMFDPSSVVYFDSPR